VVRLQIPPLRERKDDIPLLAEQMLRQLEKETGIPVEGLEPAAREALMAYSWPGNVRELRNVLEQTMHIKTGNLITRQDIPRTMLIDFNGRDTPGTPRTLKLHLAQREEELIRRAVQENRGDKCAAAAGLGISKSSLYAKILQYGIQE
jgi:transcriptional regulator with PAS, ATPase and Fis domain